MGDLTEFEEGIIDYLENNPEHAKEEFIFYLRKIMPPTCTENERKFLDEIKEKSWHVGNKWLELDCIEIKCKHNNAILNQKEFQSNLKELVEKKQ
jgi:hypothetical protein